MTYYKIWLLKLVIPCRYGRILTAALLFLILYPFFALGLTENPDDNTPALFFTCILAYIIPMFSFVTAKFEQALLDLKPILQLEDQAFDKAWSQLNSTSLRTVVLLLVPGILFGLIHMSFIDGSLGNVFIDAFSHLSGFVSTIGTLLVWTIMLSINGMLIQQTSLFARLGANNARVSILNTRKLLPFARVSMYASLTIIGALALFPLMGVESQGVKLVESLPGAVATLIPLTVIFIIPVWPIHRRLAAIKEQELAALDIQIDNYLKESASDDLDFSKLGKITPLLNYRSEILNISTWPFDGGAITRLALYLFIPPLTWAGAAMVERLVDAFV